jgi:hypothetical protein
VDYYEEYPLAVRCVTPAPLGRRLDGFNSLVRDVKVWASQLGAGESLHFDNIMALVEQQQASESVQEIMHDIKGRKEGRILAVSRLFLRLSIENDMRQQELDRELQSVRDAGQLITEILGGENEPDLADSHILDNVSCLLEESLPELGMVRQRIRSWTAISSKYEDRPLNAIPLGTGMGVKDRMDIAFESIAGKDAIPVELLELHLPLCTREVLSVFDSSFQEIWDNFIEVAVRGPWHTSEIELAAKKVQRAWNRRVEKKQKGRRILYLTSYSGVSYMQVLKKAAGLSPKLKTGFVPQDMNISFFLV